MIGIVMACRERGRDVRDERGASLIEYALLVALIAMVCLVAMSFLGISVNGLLERVNY